jgi:MerR family transcriptional regulator, aldehyde-responsive regulator
MSKVKSESVMSLSIGEVAHLTGLSIYTLRYYDELGLLPQVKRAENGHRLFDEDVLGWINIIKCLRATEMPLSDMQRFTQLAHQDIDTITQQRELLEAHRREIEQRMCEVEAAIEMIDHKILYMREAEAEKMKADS